ncbi:MAG: HIT domain-containing protein [Spirochaetes bacterium]|nr:MAG: HIT domain-containing protein [Spirochaetota bacterium]
MRRYLFNAEKLKYVRGEKPRVECILCAIRDRHPDVESLEVFRGEHMIVTVNLYPFNAGHLMIFPRRHVEELSALSDDEALELHRVTVKAIEALTQEFHPAGFNTGVNLGRSSGASIRHVHQHIVPRYDNEIGFLDVLADTRVMVVDPRDVMERLIARFSEKRP